MSLVQADVMPNIVSYNTIMNAFARTGKLDMVEKYFDQAISEDLKPDGCTALKRGPHSQHLCPGTLMVRWCNAVHEQRGAISQRSISCV